MDLCYYFCSKTIYFGGLSWMHRLTLFEPHVAYLSNNQSVFLCVRMTGSSVSLSGWRRQRQSQQSQTHWWPGLKVFPVPASAVRERNLKKTALFESYHNIFSPWRDSRGASPESTFAKSECLRRTERRERKWEAGGILAWLFFLPSFSRTDYYAPTPVLRTPGGWRR